MRFSLLIPALAVVIVSTASAQKFNPGYYINLSGDTVRKDISLQMRKGYIEKIVTADGLSLTPNDVLGFTENMVDYVVRKVSLDKTPVGGFVIDTVFLEVINRGQMSLYYMMDENDKVHFYIENENGPQELTFRVNLKVGDISSTKTETYKSALKGIFPTCTNLFTDIDRTTFNRKGIQLIYEKLYKCRFEPARVKKKKAATEFGILAGIALTAIDFKNIDGLRPQYQNTTAQTLDFSKPTTDPTAGIYLETKFIKRNIFALRQELSYYKYTSTSKVWQTGTFPTTSDQGWVNASYAKYSIIGRFYFQRDRAFRPFINVGISPMVPISISHTIEYKGIISPPPGKYPLFRSTENFNVGYLGGVGFTDNNITVELRYEISNGVNDKEVKSEVKTIFFTLSFRIIKPKNR